MHWEWISATWRRVKALLMRRQLDRDLEDELRFHLALREDKLAAAGSPPEEARDAARRRFGNVTLLKEACRELWSFALLEAVWQDVRYGARMLAKNSGSTVIVVLMLALAVGVNTAVFCWLQTIVLHPLPGVADSARLLSVIQSDRGGAITSRLSYPNFKALAGLKDVFAGVMASSPSTVILSLKDRNEWVDARVVSANAFDVLGVKPELGRTFLAEEDDGEGDHPVLVVSHSFWQRQFAGDPGIVGTTVRVNQQLFTIIGVAPADFQGVSGGSRTDLWAPLSMHDAILNYGSYSSRTFGWIQPLARLRPGIKVEQARAAVASLSAQLEKAFPDSNKGEEFKLFPLWQSPFGGQAVFLPVLRLLLAVGVGVLLIVVANVSCLLLAKATYREKEVAVRLAIGAGRSRLVRQFLTEGVLLALLGAVLGWFFANSAVKLLTAFVPAGSARFLYEFKLDAGTLLFTVLLTAATAVAYGLVPALRASRTNLVVALKESARGSRGGVRHHRALRFLIIGEMAVALALLVCAGLCVRGFQRAKRLDLGFDPRHVLYAGLNLVPNGYSPENAKVFDQALRARLAATPGITDAAFVNTPPLGGGGTFSGTVDVEGRVAAPNENRLVSFVIASPGYFSAMRIPILQGRDFTDQDDSSRANVAVINETMAARYWPGLNPLGRRFRMAVGVAPTDTFTVVGMAANAKYDSLSEPPMPLVYVTYAQRPLASLFMNVLVRTTGDPRAAASAVRREIHSLDPGVEPLKAQTLEDYISPAFLPVRVASTLMGILGGAALLLAALGLYGVMAYATGQRSQEFGIRRALGAQLGDILGLVLKDGVFLVARGAAVGLFASLAATRLLSRFLYGVSPTDPLTFLGAAIVLGTVALIACYVPARRATRVDPMVALRYE